MIFWSGPKCRARFYRYFRNEPFSKSRNELDRMTDCEVYEHFYLHYDKTADRDAELAAYEKKQAAIDAAHAEKPLEERKAEFWAMCQGFGCEESDIQAQWDEYLKGEGA